MPTSVALSPHLEAFVREQVEAGQYNNVSEVVREGLRLLQRRQQEDAAKLEVLRRAVALGVESITRGDFVVVDAVGVEALVAGIGATAAQRSSARGRASRKGG